MAGRMTCLGAAAAAAAAMFPATARSQALPDAAPPQTPARPTESPASPSTTVATTPADQDGLREIVVTAEKRSASLQKVPVTITALDAGALAATQAVTVRDLTSLVPGLTFNATAGSGLPYIRGVGQFSAAGGVESPVAIYVDGIYLLWGVGSVVNLNDIERVEVLKGPQGTLFGRNATGGVINIISRTPSETTRFEGEVGYGNYDTYEGRLYASGRLATGLSGSIAVLAKDQRDGFGYNTFTKSDILKNKNLNLHGQLHWRPDGGGTEVTLGFLYDYSKNNGNAASVDKGSLAEDGVTRYISEYDITNRVNPVVETKNYLASLRVKQEFDSFQLVSITGYHKVDQYQLWTQNGIPGGIQNPFTGATPAAIVLDPLNQSSSTVTEEFQVQSLPGSSFQWVAGAFYLDDRSISHFTYLMNDLGAPYRFINGRIDTESFAGFAQGTVPIAEATRLTAGVRYTYDRLHFTGDASGAGTIASPEAGGIATRKNYGKPTWRLVLDHDFADHVLGFVSYNRGFKSGRYVINNFSNPPALAETIDSYEAGIKSEFLDRRVRVNLSGFLYDYKNIQLRATLPGGIARVFNAASAKGRGVDLDIQAVPVRHLTLTAGAEWMPTARYTSFPFGPVGRPRPTGGVDQTGTADLSGNRMVRTPKLSLTTGVAYQVDLADSSALLFDVNDAYNSGFAWEPDNRLKQSAYHNVTASVGWRDRRDRFSVRVWGRNLADEDIRTQVTVTSTDTYYPGEPRTYGVAVGFKY